jgi:hypothetical protein
MDHDDSAEAARLSARRLAIEAERARVRDVLAAEQVEPGVLGLDRFFGQSSKQIHVQLAADRDYAEEQRTQAEREHRDYEASAATSASAQPAKPLPIDLVSLRRRRDQLREVLEQRHSAQATDLRLSQRLETRISLEVRQRWLLENQAVEWEYDRTAARYADLRAEREGTEISRRWRQDPARDFDRMVEAVRKMDDSALDLAGVLIEEIHVARLNEAQQKERSEISVAVKKLRIDHSREPHESEVGVCLGWKKADSFRKHLRANPWLVDPELNWQPPRAGSGTLRDQQDRAGLARSPAQTPAQA